MGFDDQDNLELTVLCNALVDETITSDQLSRLQQWLCESEEARRFYVLFMSQDAGLCSYAAEMQTDPADAPLNARPNMEESEFGQRLWSRIIKSPIARMRADLWRRFAPYAFAVMLLVVFLLSQAINNNSQPIPLSDRIAQPMQESTDDGVAVLTQAFAIEWDQEIQPQIGDTIPPSVLRLKSGLAQIEFYSGASLLLEGPAELQLISADQCFCRKGKCRVVVPRSAQGFTVLSADIEMIDLGTEFGVEVTPQRETQVHVFDGKVELYPPDTQRTAENRIELLAGTGRRIERSGELSPIVADPNVFVSMREMKQRVDEDMTRRADLWVRHMITVKQDPRFIVTYDFEEDWEEDRVLHNHGIGGRSLDGAVVGCEWSEGRWPGKRALEFKRPGDRVCIHVPGEYDALTLAGWIRVDGLDREYSSLMLTDGWDVGEIHWQILRSGQLRLGICHLELEGRSRGLGLNYDSPAVWNLSRIGQWIHVAVVVDNPSGFVTHFANGRELSREPLHETVKMRVGDAQIGNWRPYSDSFYKSAKGAVPIRNFNGRIDEFIIAGHALRNEDIQSLYQQGKPALQK